MNPREYQELWEKIKKWESRTFKDRELMRKNKSIYNKFMSLPPGNKVLIEDTIYDLDEMPDDLRTAIQKIESEDDTLKEEIAQALYPFLWIQSVDVTNVNNDSILRPMPLPFTLYRSMHDDNYTPQEIINAIQALITLGADVNKKERNRIKMKPLHYVIDNMRDERLALEIAKILIDAGADVNYSDRQEWTALHCASRRGFLEIVKLLLDHGADIDTQGRECNILCRTIRIARDPDKRKPQHQEIIELLTAVEQEQEKKDEGKIFLRPMLTPTEQEEQEQEERWKAKKWRREYNIDQRVQRWTSMTPEQRATSKLTDFSLSFTTSRRCRREFPASRQCLKVEFLRDGYKQTFIYPSPILTEDERTALQTVEQEQEEYNAQKEREAVERREREARERMEREARERREREARERREREAAERREREARERRARAEQPNQGQRTSTQSDPRSQWAADRVRLTQVRAALEAPHVNAYAITHVKLFPIAKPRLDPYPFTRDEDMAHLSLKNRNDGFTLEVFNPEQPEQSKVVLAQKVHDIEMSIRCHNQLNCNENILRYRSNVDQDSQWQTYPLSNLIGYENGNNVYQMRIISDKEHGDTQVRWGTGRRRVNRYYRGHFRIAITKRKSNDMMEWSLINDVPVEQYLRSVVPGEMPLTDDQSASRTAFAALKAQVIAARSYLFSKIKENRHVKAMGWDVDPTTWFQSYPGSREVRSGRVRNREFLRSDEAVEATVGVILTYRGQLAMTEYHACRRDSTRTSNSLPIFRAKKIPSGERCGRYRGEGGHGRGLSQRGAMWLARVGWDDEESPTENAAKPEDVTEPWSHVDILRYFYHGVNVQNHHEL